MADTPLFIKTFDFLTWLLERAEKFPRSQRLFATKRLLDAAFDFQERIIEANALKGNARAGKLDLADASLDKIRLYLRLSFKWKWLSEGQYHHAARNLTEIGKLLGSWKKSTRQFAAR